MLFVATYFKIDKSSFIYNYPAQFTAFLIRDTIMTTRKGSF